MQESKILHETIIRIDVRVFTEKQKTETKWEKEKNLDWKILHLLSMNDCT